MTVSRLMEILAKCPADREVWLVDDNEALALAAVMPGYPIGREWDVVLLSADDSWAGLEVLS